MLVAAAAVVAVALLGNLDVLLVVFLVVCGPFVGKLTGVVAVSTTLLFLIDQVLPDAGFLFVTEIALRVGYHSFVATMMRWFDTA